MIAQYAHHATTTLIQITSIAHGAVSVSNMNEDYYVRTGYFHENYINADAECMEYDPIFDEVIAGTRKKHKKRSYQDEKIIIRSDW